MRSLARGRIGLWSLAIAVLLTPDTAQAQEGEASLLTALDSLLNVPVNAAAKYTQTQSEAASSITIVTADDIETYGYRTLDDVFQNVRGFYVSNDRNYSYLGVRGFSRPSDYNNRVLMLVDGHNINENLYGSTTLGTGFGLDMSAIDRIEIVRGPGSALYGTGAMFAVVNVVTKSADMIDGVEVSGGAGTFGSKRGTAMAGTTFDNGVELVVSGQWIDDAGEDLFFSEFNDPETNNGMSVGLDWDRSYGGNLSLDMGDFTFRAAHTSREKGIPTGAWEIDFNDPEAQTHDEWSFAELRFERRLGADVGLTVRGFADRYVYDGAYPYEEDGTWFDENTSRWFGSEAMVRWDPASNNRLVVGAEGRNNTSADYHAWDEWGETYADGNHPYTTYSLFVQDEWQVTPKLALTGGIRHDEHSEVGGATTPRLAVVYHPANRTSLKLLYGEAFRAPTVWELNFDEFEDTGLPAPDLKPERIRTHELVLEQGLSNMVSATVSGFQYSMTDLIDFVLVGDPADDEWQYGNVASVDAYGVEAQLTAAFGRGASGHVSYTYQHAEDADLKTSLSNLPTHMVKLSAGAPAGDFLRLGANVLYETGRLTVREEQTEAFLLVDLTVSTRPFAGGLSLSASLKNAFDTEYRTPGGWEHAQDGILQPSRRLFVGLRFAG